MAKKPTPESPEGEAWVVQEWRKTQIYRELAKTSEGLVFESDFGQLRCVDLTTEDLMVILSDTIGQLAEARLQHQRDIELYRA